MPFKSKSQRRLFYHLKHVGKIDQKTIDEWESSTPDKIPERLHKKGEAMIDNFWTGFQKRAAETYVSANPAMEAPGAPEKMLKWNDHGGVDPRTPEEIQAADAVGLLTLPVGLSGACCETCMHFRPLTEALGHGFCTNPEVKMDVTKNMHCMRWSNPDVHDPVLESEKEQQAQQVEQAQEAQMQGAVQPQQPQQQPQQPQQPQQQAPQLGSFAKGSPAQEEPEVPAESNTPSPVGTQSGFPEGAQTSANPLVEQAVNDFQGQGAAAGPTGGGEEAAAAPEAKPKKPAKKPSEGGGKGHTININVGKEKKASAKFWGGIVPGY